MEMNENNDQNNDENNDERKKGMSESTRFLGESSDGQSRADGGALFSLDMGAGEDAHHLVDFSFPISWLSGDFGLEDMNGIASDQRQFCIGGRDVVRDHTRHFFFKKKEE